MAIESIRMTTHNGFMTTMMTAPHHFYFKWWWWWSQTSLKIKWQGRNNLGVSVNDAAPWYIGGYANFLFQLNLLSPFLLRSQGDNLFSKQISVYFDFYIKFKVNACKWHYLLWWLKVALRTFSPWDLMPTIKQCTSLNALRIINGNSYIVVHHRHNINRVGIYRRFLCRYRISLPFLTNVSK